MTAARRTQRATPTGVLEERRSSPGLLLALLGQDAMRRLRAAHMEVGLSPRQFQLLGLLHDEGPMSQRELGAVMGIDPSVLVTLLNPLEAAGQISREREPTDRRRHTVVLTSAGARYLERAARAQREAEDELFDGLDGGQREQLRALLLLLDENLAATRRATTADSPEDTPPC